MNFKHFLISLIVSIIILFVVIIGVGIAGYQSFTHNKSSVTVTTVTQVKSASLNKTIPFKYFYAGFVLQNNTMVPIGDNSFPVGTIVINTKQEWEDFKTKYLYNKNGEHAYPDMSTRFNVPADFDKESIIYCSILSSKPDVFTFAYQIDKIEIQDNKPNVIMKDLDNFEISTSNFQGADFSFIVLVTVNKSDLPNRQ